MPAKSPRRSCGFRRLRSGLRADRQQCRARRLRNPVLSWPEPIPTIQDPFKRFRRLPVAALKDADPRAAESQRQMREIGEFLLVPCFGACIHSAPPPANQIVLPARWATDIQTSVQG